MTLEIRLQVWDRHTNVAVYDRKEEIYQCTCIELEDSINLSFFVCVHQVDNEIHFQLDSHKRNSRLFYFIIELFI